jgi:hypothetical protein
MIGAAYFSLYVGIRITQSLKPGLKFPGIFPDIMPESSQISPVPGPESFGKRPGLLSHRQQMVFKSLPILLRLSGKTMGVIFLIHSCLSLLQKTWGRNRATSSNVKLETGSYFPLYLFPIDTSIHLHYFFIHLSSIDIYNPPFHLPL